MPDIAIRLGTAVLSGLGVVGLATLAGGAILFLRFQALQLPTEQAVAVVPRTELLTIGAEALVPLTFVLLIVFLVVRALLLRFSLLPKAREHRGWLALMGLPLVLAVLLYYSLAIHRVRLDASFGEVALVALAGLLACVLVGMPRPKDHKWGWFALTVVLVIAGVATGVSWIRTYHAPDVRPAALIRSSTDQGIAGLFIAETSDQLYLARVDDVGESNRGEPRTGRLIDVPLSDVKAVSIGQNQSLPQALKRAPELLSELTLCETPAATCGDDLTNLLPGFPGLARVEPLLIQSVALGKGLLTFVIQSREPFSIRATRIMVESVVPSPGAGRPGRSSRVTLAVGSKTVAIASRQARLISLTMHKAPAVKIMKGRRATLTITLVVRAPNGTQTSESITRVLVRRVEFAALTHRP